MFFDFSFDKIIRLGLVLVIVLGATFTFVWTHPNFTVPYIADISESYLNKGSATASYWWSYKLFALGNSSDLMSRLTSPALVAYQTFAKEINLTPSSSIEIDQSAQNRPAYSIPVLLYHGEGNEGLSIPQSTFVEHMRYLKENGWKSITLEEFYGFIKSGKKLPEKSFLLTFDDGRKDSYYPKDPVLKDYGFNAVMFVVTGFSLPNLEEKKSTFYLSRAELDQMLRTGRWELQSHGKEDHVFYAVDSQGTEGHFLSNLLWLPDQNRLETEEEFRSRIINDLTVSKTTLEKVFGKPVLAYAYPFSDYGPDTENFKKSESIIDQVVPSIYDLSFYQVWPSLGDSFNYPDSSSYKMKRIEPLSDWSGEDLIETLNAGRAKEIPYVSGNFGKEWIKTWGQITASDEALTLKALPNTTGAATFLDGSGWWKNYTLKATLTLEYGSNIMLVARHQDSKNFLYCAFSKDRIALRETVQGVTSTIENVPHSFQVSRKGTELYMSVSGNTVGCYENGKLVVSSSSINPTLKDGGVGIQVWDDTFGVAKATVTRIEVIK